MLRCSNEMLANIFLYKLELLVICMLLKLLASNCIGLNIGLLCNLFYWYISCRALLIISSTNKNDHFTSAIIFDNGTSRLPLSQHSNSISAIFARQ